MIAISTSRGPSRPLKEWWFVAFGDVVVVEFAYGLDASGEVLRAGASTFGHHHAAIAAVLDSGWLTGPQGGCGLAQGGKQLRAAGSGGVCVSGRRGQDQGAVGQLLLAPSVDPAIERHQQMMAATR